MSGIRSGEAYAGECPGLVCSACGAAAIPAEPPCGLACPGHLVHRDIKPENMPKAGLRNAFLTAAEAIDSLPDTERQRVLRALAALYPTGGEKP